MAGRGLVQSGPRAKFLIEGVPVMYATNVSYSEEIQYDPVEVLDLLEVAEHVPLAYRVTLNCQFVRIVTNPIKNRDGVAIMPTLEGILFAPELTCTLIDSVTGLTIANFERVKCSRHSVGQGAKAMALEDVDFVCIRMRDESEIR